MELVAVRAEQQAASALPVQHGAQFIPRDFKLCRGARVAELVQPCEFEQNIQAADKCAGCCGFCVRTHRILAVAARVLPVRLR